MILFVIGNCFGQWTGHRLHPADYTTTATTTNALWHYPTLAPPGGLTLRIEKLLIFQH